MERHWTNSKKWCCFKEWILALQIHCVTEPLRRCGISYYPFQYPKRIWKHKLQVSYPTLTPKKSVKFVLVLVSNKFLWIPKNGPLDLKLNISYFSGAGRSGTNTTINHSVGIQLISVAGDKIAKGDDWICVYHSETELNEALRWKLESAICIDSKAPILSSKILKTIKPTN